jgi:hypothetical protein
MSADVLDFALKKAERLAETLEPIPVEPEEPEAVDVIMECPNCQNKAFTILTASKDKPSSIPGFDFLCTACNTIITLTGEVLMVEAEEGE